MGFPSRTASIRVSLLGAELSGLGLSVRFASLGIPRVEFWFDLEGSGGGKRVVAIGECRRLWRRGVENSRCFATECTWRAEASSSEFDQWGDSFRSRVRGDSNVRLEPSAT